MPTIEITLTRPKQNEIILQQKLEISVDLAATFLQELDQILAGLPAQKRVIKKVDRRGQAVTIIDLIPRPPTVTGPTFQERFYRRRLINDDTL